MCLSSGWKFVKKPKKDVIFGWKVFHKYTWNNTIFPQIANKGKSYKIGIWNKAANNNQRHDYGIGFHIFKTKKAASNWKIGVSTLVVRKVKGRGLTVIGSQIGKICYVCQEMMILPEKKRKVTV